MNFFDNQQFNIVIPEVSLTGVLNSFLNFLRSESSLPKEDQWLRIFFGTTRFDKVKYYDQAAEIFYRTPEHPRYIYISQGYALDRAISGVPSIHITLPGEKEVPSIGFNEGYRDPIIDEERAIVRPFYILSKQTTFNIIITSDNPGEALIIYHVLQAMFSTTQDFTEAIGMKNMTIGGADLQIDPNLVPPHIFHRNISCSFMYEVSSPSIVTDQLMRDFIFRAQIEGEAE